MSKYNTWPILNVKNLKAKNENRKTNTKNEKPNIKTNNEIEFGKTKSEKRIKKNEK